MNRALVTCLSAVLVFLTAVACSSIESDAGGGQPSTAVSTVTPPPTVRPVPDRVVDTTIDTTSSQTLGQVGFNTSQSFDVAKQAADAGDEWIWGWLNSQVFTTDQTFADVRFPDRAVLTVCTSPTPAPPFWPPADMTDYNACVVGNEQAEEQFHQAVEQKRLALAPPPAPPLDNTGTPVFDALVKAQETLDSYPPPTVKVLVIYSDLQNNWGGPVTLHLQGIHMIVVLAINDASTYQQAQEQWAKTLGDAGAASIKFFYPGSPAANIAAAIPSGH